MARKTRESNNQCAFHIYARSNNRINFGISKDDAWEIFSIYLYFISRAYKVKIYAFSMMSNHIHMLCEFPENNLSEAMRYFMTETSRSINQQRGSINHVYGGRFKSTLIEKPEHFFITYKYVLQNPLRSGETEDLTDFKYTNYSTSVGQYKGIIPISPISNGLSYLIPSCYLSQKSWLHDEVSEKSLDIIRKSLRKKVFKIAKQLGTGLSQTIKF